MYLLNKYNLNKINILNFLISTLPLTFILGNLATNINVVMICFLGILNFRKKIFFIEKKIYQYFLYSFFIFIIITTFINNTFLIENNILYKQNLFKSLFFLRYLLLFIIISKLIEKNIFDIKLFFTSCAFFSFFVCIDLLIQFFLKKNILGYPIIYGRPSSFFKEELIAGGYIQRFILFFIFLSAIKIKNKYKFFIEVMFIIFLIPIILSGNKMPVLIFVGLLFLYLFVEKKFKESFILILVFTIFIVAITNSHFNSKLRDQLMTIYQETTFFVTHGPKLFLNKDLEIEYLWRTGYLIHFNTGIQIWKENKIFGNGIKSFRIKCSYNNSKTCNTHPHSYFIELMSDLGLVGIILIYTIILLGIKDYLKFYFQEKNINKKYISIVFFLIIFAEFFPLRASGSFFTTNNATFIFLILPLFLNFNKLVAIRN